MFHVLWWSIMKWLDLKIELLPASESFLLKNLNLVNVQVPKIKLVNWYFFLFLIRAHESSKVLHVFTADHHSTTASFLPLSFFFWLTCWYRKYDIRFWPLKIKKPWHAHQRSRAARGGKSENSWFRRNNWRNLATIVELRIFCGMTFVKSWLFVFVV